MSDVFELSLEVAKINGDQMGIWPEHDWKRDENGVIDEYAYEDGYHHGPSCVRCGARYCYECSSGRSDLCEANPKQYADSLTTLIPVVDAYSTKHKWYWSIGNGSLSGSYKGIITDLDGYEVIKTAETLAYALAEAFVTAVKEWIDWKEAK